MPTLEDLMGGGQNFGPRVVNLKNVGDFVKGVITDINPKGLTYEWDVAKGKPGLQKFWVDGKPKGVPADEAERAGLNPVYQLEITLQPYVGQGEWLAKAGDAVRVPINSKDEREAFKAAVVEADGSIDVGDTFGKRLDKRDGNKKEHSMKVSRPTA